MDWSKLELVVYAREAATAHGEVFLPGDRELHELTLAKQDGVFKLNEDPLAGRVTWQVRSGSGE
jgi:alpha-D-xyloside xylohydrolase